MKPYSCNLKYSCHKYQKKRIETERRKWKERKTKKMQLSSEDKNKKIHSLTLIPGLQ